MVSKNQIGFEARRFGLAALMRQGLVDGTHATVQNGFHAYPS
jgi:hypothetical protein